MKVIFDADSLIYASCFKSINERKSKDDLYETDVVVAFNKFSSSFGKLIEHLMQEEKFCEKLFKFLSSAAYRDSWKTFLGSSIQKKACPTFYQAVTDHMMEELAKIHFSVETPAPTPPPPSLYSAHRTLCS